MSGNRQIWFWIVAVVTFCLLLYLLRGILLPFVAGMAVAYFLDPSADRLERWGCSRTLATIIITAVFMLVVVGMVLLIVPVLQRQLVDFLDKVPEYRADLQRAVLYIFSVLQDRLPPEDVERLREGASEYVGQAIGWLLRALKGIWSGGVALASLLSLLFITPVVTFYLLRDWDPLVRSIDSWLPRAHAEVIREQMRLVDRTLAGFVRGQATVCGILGVYYGVALSLAGLQFGLVVGLGAGVISFIPYVGSIVGVLVSVGLAAAQFGEWQPIAIVAGIFAVGQIMEGYVLSPKLVGGRVGLHAVWIIFALFAGGALLGFVGVLLAIPVAAVIGVLGRFALERYLKSPLYSGKAPPGGKRRKRS